MKFQSDMILAKPRHMNMMFFAVLVGIPSGEYKWCHRMMDITLWSFLDEKETSLTLSVRVIDNVSCES